MTVEAFLDWLDTNQDDGKYELHDGVIVAMGRQQAGHVREKRRIADVLEAAIKKAGAPCEAFVDGLAVAIRDHTTYIPDALVNCGERLSRDATLAPNPVIVVEVISPSSRGRDMIVKMEHYLTLPPVAHYVAVHGDTPAIYHHYRGEGGTFITAVAKTLLRLDPPGIELDLTSLFDEEGNGIYVSTIQTAGAIAPEARIRGQR